MIEATFAKISGLLAGAFGSLLAMYFDRDNVKRMETWEKCFVFISGVLLAHWAGGGIIHYFNIAIHSVSADGIKLAVGLFGMGGLAEAKNQIPKFINGLRKKHTGEGE